MSLSGSGGAYFADRQQGVLNRPPSRIDLTDGAALDPAVVVDRLSAALLPLLAELRSLRTKVAMVEALCEHAQGAQPVPRWYVEVRALLRALQ